MKVVILCGGKGSRLKTAADDKPKPLALVNGKPILWHINDFILDSTQREKKLLEEPEIWKGN